MADFSDLDISTLIERIDVLLESLKGYDDLTDNEVAFMIQSEQIKEWLWMERDIAFARSLAEPNEFPGDRSEEFSQRFMSEIHGDSSEPYPPEAIRRTFGKYFAGTAYIRPILKRRLSRSDSRMSARQTRSGSSSSNPPSIAVALPRPFYSQQSSNTSRVHPISIISSSSTISIDGPLRSRSNSPTPAGATVPHASPNDTEFTPANGAAAAVPVESSANLVVATLSPGNTGNSPTQRPLSDTRLRSHSSTHIHASAESPMSNSLEMRSSPRIGNRNTGPTPIVITPMRATYPRPGPSHTRETPTATQTSRTSVSSAKGKAPDMPQAPSTSADTRSRGKNWGLADAEPGPVSFSPGTSTPSKNSPLDDTSTPYTPQVPSSSVARPSSGGSTPIVTKGTSPSSSNVVNEPTEIPSPSRISMVEVPEWTSFTDDLLQEIVTDLTLSSRTTYHNRDTVSITPTFVEDVVEPGQVVFSPSPHQPSAAPSSATPLQPYLLPGSPGPSTSLVRVAYPPPDRIEIPQSRSQIPPQRPATPRFETYAAPSVLSDPPRSDPPISSASSVEVPQIQTSPSPPASLEIYAVAGPSRPHPEVEILSDSDNSVPSSPLSGSDASSILDALTVDAPKAPRNDFLQCSICFEDTPPEESFESPCSHIYCADCVERFVENFTRDETLFPFRCCQEPIAPQDVVPFIPDSLRILFNEKIAEYGVAVRFRLYCYSQPCSVFLGSYPPIVIRRNSIISVRCSECRLLTCPKCKQVAHPEEPECRDHEAAVELRRLARGMGWQKCSSCKWLVERTDGCNHLVCRCGYQFCYACAKPWDTIHDCNPNTDYA